MTNPNPAVQHNLTETVEELVPTLKQPKNVEQYGLEPVPDEERKVGWFSLFQIIINVLLNPGLILISGLAVAAGLPFWASVIAMTLGVVMAFIPYTILATIGVDYGLPGTVATRAFLGIRGSQVIIGGMRTISSAFWFAFTTLAGAAGIVAIIKSLFNADVSLIVVSLLFAVAQAVVALFGYHSLKWLSRVAFPVKLFVIAYLLWWLATSGAPGFAPAEVFSFAGTEGWNWSIIAVWASGMAVGWFAQVTDAADYCRYTNSRVQMWTATLLAAVVGGFGAAFFGAYAAAGALGKTANAFEVIPSLNPGVVTLLLLLLLLVLDNWTVNVMNLYTGGLALANLISKLGRFWSTIVVAIFGTVLAAFPFIVEQFTDAINILGYGFAPLVGVFVADYFMKRGHIDVLGLFDRKGPYWYFHGFNLSAVAWVIIGAIGYNFVPVWLMQGPAVAVAVGIGHALTTSLLKRLGPDKPLTSASTVKGNIDEDGRDASLVS
ncbi:purine-cytosine permease family protein [Zafaria sp. J156]|uniref:purine-cytosine permease family protein n=1 Tax=Micrococcaceae TaxID=1268 RepID=UPI002E76E70E|nr:cytosine permease [Zafaria sp. J156]MEE1622755.1 cytosine permease [Zafaria sp. J156]